jgi:hypothetical protein
MSERSSEAPLKPKEGILLDQEGNPIYAPKASGSHLGFRLTLGPWLGALAMVGLVFAGFTLIGTLLSVFFAFFIGIWVLRTVLGLFGLGRRSH